MSNQYPQQPSWAAPHQPDGTPQPPKKKLGPGKIVGIGCLGIVGIFIVLAAIGAAVGGGKTDSKASAAKNSITASPSPSSAKPAASKSTPAKAPAKPTHTTVSKKPASPTTHAPAKLSVAESRKKAAAVLVKEDADFGDFLARGEDVVGTPEFTAWYQKAVVGLDMQQTAFKKADAYFTADTEPTDLLEQWRSDNGDANAAITQYANDGTSPDAPNAATRKDAADCRAALAKADKDAAKIAAGG